MRLEVIFNRKKICYWRSDFTVYSMLFLLTEISFFAIAKFYNRVMGLKEQSYSESFLRFCAPEAACPNEVHDLCKIGENPVSVSPLLGGTGQEE